MTVLAAKRLDRFQQNKFCTKALGSTIFVEFVNRRNRHFQNGGLFKYFKERYVLNGL